MLNWTDPVFLDEAAEWIRLHATVTGEIEQTHVQPWSTVLRVPATDGIVWFKAVSDVHWFEPSLTVLLAHVRPDVVPEVIAADTHRGWMLLQDGGSRLRDIGEELAHWEAILPEYGELQLAVVQDVSRFLDLGVPDERLSGLPERVERLLASDEFLMLDHADGLTGDDRCRLQALVPDIASMCRELAGYGIPETIQHDDLNDGNVFVNDGRYRTLDWGDACVSHPFHSLTVLLRATAYRLHLQPGGAELMRLRDAYLEPFAGSGTRDELVAAADLAYRTGTLARSLAWHRYVASMPPDERADDLDSVPYGLKKFLEGGPIGSWR